MAAVVFESIQVMGGDNTDSIPELLLAEDADAVDAADALATYGIESIFTVRCEIANIDHEPRT